ncbi:MAG: ABC transporter substrate-binding protein [Candidatus Rokubacteria bacterium]|nr:ABC transporter substrate-binding protein [Candidatus Rokubacteria bacterium]
MTSNVRVMGKNAAIVALCILCLGVWGATAEAAQKTKIEFWTYYTGPDGKVMASVVEAFNKQSPDVEVAFRVPGWGADLTTKVATAMVAGAPPALLALHDWEVPAFKGKIHRLTDEELAKLGIKKADFYETPWNLGVFEGERLGIAESTGTVNLYYNRDMFKAAGLDPNKPPTNREEFVSAAVKLTRDLDGDGKIDQWGFCPRTRTHPDYHTWIWQNGGQYLTSDRKKAAFNTPEAEAALQFGRDLIFKYKVCPPDPGRGTAPQDEFYAGRQAMHINGPWEVSKMLQQNAEKGTHFDVAKIPWIFDKVKSIYGSNHVWIYPIRRSEDKAQFQAALKFTAWFFKEGNKLWFPAYGTISKPIEAWAREQRDPKITTLVLWTEQQKYIRFLPAVEAMREAEDIFFAEFSKAIWRNDIPIKEVLTTAEKRVNAALAK